MKPKPDWLIEDPDNVLERERLISSRSLKARGAKWDNPLHTIELDQRLRDWRGKA